MSGFAFSDGHRETLLGGGVLVFDHVLGEEATRACRATLDGLTDHLVDARVGDSGHTRIDKAVRSDRVFFVPQGRVPPGMDRLWFWFRALQLSLFANSASRVETEFQIACYPGDGAHYVRHLDLRGPTDERRATAVWYPNVGWTPDHGGVLRAHTPQGLLDIEPLADRAVLFLAEKVPHEVLPAKAPRWAISAFYSLPSKAL